MKKKNKNIIIIIALILIIGVVGLLIFLINRNPIVLYEYYINDNKVQIPGKHLVSYDCTNGVEVSYDEKENTYTTNNLKKNSTCKLFFEENIYDYLEDLGYSNDTIKEDNKVTRDSNNNTIYYSSSAKNNIYFNCSDYKDKSTCEEWMIIGTKTFEDKKMVKIIRKNSISVKEKDSSNIINKFSWNNSIGNDLSFDNSSLYDILSTGYYLSINNYNYLDKNNNTRYLDFTNYGLKNDETRKMIIPSEYYVSMNSNINMRAEDYSLNESSGHSLNLAIGIPNISDYVNSFGSTCSGENVANFSKCQGDSYMSTNEGMWLMNVSSLDSSTVYRTLKEKAINPVYPTIEYEVVPVLYIDGNLKIVSGDGSETNPYMIAY